MNQRNPQIDRANAVMRRDFCRLSGLTFLKRVTPQKAIRKISVGWRVDTKAPRAPYMKKKQVGIRSK